MFFNRRWKFVSQFSSWVHSSLSCKQTFRYVFVYVSNVELKIPFLDPKVCEKQVVIDFSQRQDVIDHSRQKRWFCVIYINIYGTDNHKISVKYDVSRNEILLCLCNLIRGLENPEHKNLAPFSLSCGA